MRQMRAATCAMLSWIITAKLCLVSSLAGSPLANAADPLSGTPTDMVDPLTYRAWQAIRQLDCARCHGKHFEGSSGPSLLIAARTLGAEGFQRVVLEGVSERGMPPYGSVTIARENISGIYAYFLGRAQGQIAPGVLRPRQERSE